MNEAADIVVVGAGAAGLMAAVSAARTTPGLKVVAVDGARKLGAKILVSGGGRCNVTNERVTPDDFAGGSRNAIRKILGRFSADDTVRFFSELDVELKPEENGKLFPTTDSAQTVLEALLAAAVDAGVELRHPFRVEAIEKRGTEFRIVAAEGDFEARRVILATGGKSLPRTGSDGGGYRLAQTLGHTPTARIFPALVPLLLPQGHVLTTLSGMSATATLTVASATGKKLASATGSLLCTHFGLSGPAALDISRYWTEARANDPEAQLLCNWLPEETAQSLDEALREPGPQTPFGRLRRRLPERLARTILEQAAVSVDTASDQLTRTRRIALVETTTAWPLAVRGDRGWNFAEVTAGGIPVEEFDPSTMQSRRCPGLYLCGEICDVDGRIGGFNFQWAWSGGSVAGRAAALDLSGSPD
jgi:predicted Rossmann fold flavoprotein